MKSHKVLVFVVLALLVAVFALPATAAPRQCVILEGFTQWNCPPCANWNPQELGVLEQMTRDTVVSVKYHGWWPGANDDPFFLWNQSENTARINMYNVSGVPTTKLDGYLTINQSTSQLRSSVRSEYAMDCPCSMNCIAITDEANSTIHVYGIVNAEDDLNGKRVFVALIRDNVSGPPYGSNGETAWYDVFGDMGPNATGGVTLNIANGEFQNFQTDLNYDPSWNLDNLSIVAWVQDMGSREILQGMHTDLNPDYAFLSGSTGAAQMYVPLEDHEYTYSVSLSNFGTQNDVYTVDLQGDFPAGWTYTIEADGVDPSSTSIQVPLNTGESTNLTIRVNNNGNPGYVDFAADISTPNEPLLTGHYEYRIMSGLDILVVDDDDGEDFETYYMDALAPYTESTGMVAGLWDVNADALDENFLDGVDVVIWFTGNTFQTDATLSPLDQLMLGDYLTAGGTLLLSGQGIGFDIRTDQFMSDNLHAHYERNWPQGQSISGVAGDPVSDGLAADLHDGDGADNQTRQTAMSPLDDMATPIFTYDQEGTGGEVYNAAMRIEAPAWPSGVYRCIYLGFGFEAVADAQTRTNLMASSIEWLRGAIQGVDDNPSVTVPNTFELGQNFPNPFNPETTIPFSLAARSNVTLSIYDILGRKVADLANGSFEAGQHTVNWNPTDLSSGIYFYTINAVAGDNTFHSTRKLVLMK